MSYSDQSIESNGLFFFELLDLLELLEQLEQPQLAPQLEDIPAARAFFLSVGKSQPCDDAQTPVLS